MMAVNPEKKERTIKGDQCDLAKDPPTVKSVFSLGQRKENSEWSGLTLGE